MTAGSLERVEAPAASGELDLSVVVPVKERPAPLDQLFDEYAAPLRAAGVRFEFLFVLDPRHADRAAALRGRSDDREPIRVLQLAQPFGEATMLKVGVDAARGRAVLTLPPYPRVEATAIPALLDALTDGTDVAVARRWPRQDGPANRLQSAVFNRLLGRLDRQRLHDIASGVAAMPRSVLRDLPLYGDFARFLPLLAHRAGYRVRELPCPQHAEDAHARIHRPGVYLRRLIDILGVFFVLRFTERPLRFFGLIGGSVALGGGVLLAVLAAQKLGGQGIANRPALLLAVLLVVLGIQAIALGLIGEIIVHLLATRRETYRLVDDDG
ncbi:MAG: hypothetical protein R2909_08675 [Gemmatimonadales bacterium]